MAQTKLDAAGGKLTRPWPAQQIELCPVDRLMP
jgi:hypothetical protein